MPRYAPNRHKILSLSRQYGPVNTAGILEHTDITPNTTVSSTLSKMIDAGLLKECEAARGTYMLSAAGVDLLNQWDSRK